MKTPNIFYINPNNGIRGGNKIVFEHCNHLAKLFQKCFIICNDKVPDWMKVDAYFLDYDTAKRLVQPEDIVIFHWDYDVNFALSLSAVRKYYLVQSFMHYDEDIFKLPINFITVSGYIQRHTKDTYKVDSTLILNAIDHSIFFPSEEDREAGRIFIIKRMECKGAQDVISAENLVRKYVPNAKFIYKDNLNEKEIAQEYRKADIFVFPSWYEGFGLPALEAMACGSVVVTTDSKGVDDFAFHDKNCLKVSIKNPNAIADALIDLLSDTVKKERLRTQGLETSKKFVWGNSIYKLADLFGLREKIYDTDIFKHLTDVKALTTVFNRVYQPFGKQVVVNKTVLSWLIKYIGYTPLPNLLKYFGLKETRKSGDFDYNKISFVDREGDKSYINCKEGAQILYVPDHVWDEHYRE